ncbi:MAG: TIGR02301 family protein [Pseudomonadota bacterium]
MVRRSFISVFFLSVACLLPSTTISQTAATAPYDTRLNRLAEVLGSVHYLSNLCEEPSNQWRDAMQNILSVESPAPNRRADLIASFNRGYRSFNSVHQTCTDQARQLNLGYVQEGQSIAAEITARYGE